MTNTAVPKTDDSKCDNMQYRTYALRWLILTIFILYTFSNSFQWGQYVIINKTVQKYYNVRSSDVDWTMIIYMVAYMPLIFPALWLLNEIGIRTSMTLSSIGLCAAAWIKFYAAFSEDRFSLVLIGTTIGAVSQVVAFGLAARVTAVWFGSNEVSFACALAVFGDQFGSAIGLLLPTYLVKDTDKPTVRQQLILLCSIIAVANTVIMISVLIFFKERPKTPPSAADAMQRKVFEQSTILQDLKVLFTKPGFILMMMAYGANNGVFNSFMALLNSIFLSYFPEEENHVGIIGFTIMISGIVSSVILGYYLDRTHLYKDTILFIYITGVIGMISFLITFRSKMLSLVYVSAIIVGFSQIGFYSVAVQLGIEISYPISECNSSSCLLLASHICGVICSNFFRYVLEKFSNDLVIIAMSITLFIGTLINFLVPSKLRRQNLDTGIVLKEIK